MSLLNRLEQSMQRGKISEFSAFSGFQERMKDMVREEVEHFKGEIMEELRRIMNDKIGEEGITTLKGERGYTPQREIDYFTSEEIKGIKDELRPIKGKDYFDGIDGMPGKNPSKKELAFLLGLEIKKLKLPKNFKVEEMADAIARSLEKLQGNNRLDYQALKNKPGIPAYTQKKFAGRGGGGGINELIATGTINGSNVTFTFVQEPSYIVSDGLQYKKNAGWTWSYPTATLSIPPTYSLWGIG